MVEHALCLCAHVLAIFNICTCMYYILLEVNICNGLFDEHDETIQWKCFRISGNNE